MVVVHMLWSLLVAGSLAAQTPVTKIKDLVRDEKYDKAVDQCDKLLSKTPDDQVLRETCADAAWHVVGQDQRSLDAFAALWPGTTAGDRAHREAGVLALERAGDDPDRLRDLVAHYGGTLPAQEAERRLTHAYFLAARDAGDAQSMEMFLKLHPDAAHTAMAVNMLQRRRFDETAAWNTVAAWQDFLDAWPDHPQRDEALERQADCAFAEAATPEALLAFALAWPEHARAVEALEGALPLLVSVTHRDDDLAIATSSLDTVEITAPEGVTASLWVAGQPAPEICEDAPEPLWLGGQLQFPFGGCAVDGPPVAYLVRAGAGSVFLDFPLTVHQAHTDPTLDQALRLAPIGLLKEGCEVPGNCSPSRLAFGAGGALLAGVQGPPGDEEVAWWPVPAPGESLDEPVEAAGTWRGPLASISALGLSPDGTRLAVGYCSESLATLYLVDIASDRILGTRDGLCPQALSFAPGGLALAVVSEGGVLVIDGQTAVTREELQSDGAARVAAWSPDGDRLAWWGQDETNGRLHVWSGGAVKRHGAVGTAGHQPRQLALSPGDDRTCLLGDDAYWCWDGATGRPMRTVDFGAVQGDAGGRPVTMAAASELVVVGPAEGGVAVHDGRTAERLLSLDGPEGAVSSVLLSADGGRLVAVDAEGAITLWGVR